MTRINLVPPAELSDRHLIAEYRELPRVFGLMRAYAARSDSQELPGSYTLGKGHVRFFYDKGAFLYRRQVQLILEMKRRGFNPKFDDPYGLLEGVPDRLLGDYDPSPEALAINRQRIEERSR